MMAPPAVASETAAAKPVDPPPAPPPPPEPTPQEKFAAWLRPKLPAGGEIQTEGATTRVVHTVAAADTAQTIAKAYLDLTDIYFASDLAKVIAKENPKLTPGSTITIPHLLEKPYPTADEGRLAWPEDHALKGVFITGLNAAITWPDVLAHLGARHLNAVVLDGKDYMGPITYPTKVKLANENGAGFKNPWIPDLARAIRFAHMNGVRVIMRVACFHDPWTAEHTPRLSIQGDWGKPFPMGWLDPVNEEVQQYILDLVTEQIDLGADEIQLDYIRFPVHGGINHAILPSAKPKDGEAHGDRVKAIAAFVHRVHEVTKARHVPLSLDLFGVTATGDKSDMEMLGQDIGVLGTEAEALSPMVYPSHYAPGFNGWKDPGNHPEIVGMGTKAALARLADAHVTDGAVIRPWLQASSYKTPDYGPGYLVAEAKSAESNGGAGWLMWSPSCEYSAAWFGWPAAKDAVKSQ